MTDRTNAGAGASTYWESCLAPAAIQAKIANRYGAPVAFEPMDHHDCHLHSHLASAPFDNCLAIVMDAAGETGSAFNLPYHQRRAASVVSLSDQPVAGNVLFADHPVSWVPIQRRRIQDHGIERVGQTQSLCGVF